MQVKTGSYTGNGTDNRTVTGIGFQPDLVIVKRANTGDTAFFRTASMASGSSMTLRGDNGIVTGGIKTLDSDGFTLGTNGEVNANSVTYYYLAVKKDSSNDFDYGTYTGNASDNRNLTLQSNFAFNWLVIKGDGGRTGAYRSKDLSGDKTHAFYFTGTNTDQIQSMSTTTGDVQLGTSDFVNANSRTYYWFGFKEVAGFSSSFTYTGNGSDNRDISIPSTTFQPGFVWIKQEDNSDPRFRTAAHSGDSSQSFDGSTETNSIQGFNSTGFQVGNNSQVNDNTKTYHVLALKEGSSATTTTRTQTGVSRIQKTVAQTQTGKSRVTATTSKTQTGVAKIATSSTVQQTTTGKAAIRKTTAQTQTGAARIQKTISRTQDGKARITTVTLQTITGKSSVRNTANRTITGKARITATVLQTISGRASILNTVTQSRTITGKAAIRNTAQRTINGVARISGWIQENRPNDDSYNQVSRPTNSTYTTVSRPSDNLWNQISRP